MKTLLSIFYFLVGFYILLCVVLYFFQSKLIFFPTKLPIDHTFHFNGEFEEKFFQTDAESTIHALHFFSKNPKGVILYFHGNAGSLDDWGGVADDFVKMDYDVLITDYRGFGKSTGEISEANFYKDAQMLYDFLLEKYDASHITIFGRSLGSGVATNLAAGNKAERLILETPFANFADLAKSRFNIFPVKALLQFDFSNKDKMEKIDCPVHIFHGTNDRVIPFAHAKELKSVLKDGSTFTTIKNGDHNNLFTFPTYWTKLKAILK